MLLKRSAPQPDRIGLLSDDPVELGPRNDAFGRRDYALSLHSAIEAAPSGTTFGLFGQWGTGKSSVIQTLKALQQDDVAVVVFDAWRYKEDAFRRAFLYDISEQLVTGRWLRGFDLDRDLRHLDVDTSVPHEIFAISWRRLMQLTASICLLVVALLAVNGDIVGSTKGTVGLLGLMSLVTWFATRADHLLELRTETESRRRLEDADRFSRRFYQIVGAVRAQRCVVAIDNVDRLDPRAAVEVLATIKTYLEPAVRSTRNRRRFGWITRRRAPQVCFVVAVDDSALRAHLASDAPDGTSDADAYADEYLRKFFAVRLSLREPTHSDMRAYVATLASELVERWEARLCPADRDRAKWRELQVGHLSDTILARPYSNPRRVKQYVNSVEMALTLTAARIDAGRLETFPADIGLVSVFVHMEEECPYIFGVVLRDHELFDQLHAAAQERDDSPDESFASDWDRLVPVLRASYSVDRSGASAYLQSRASVEPRRSESADRLIRAMRTGDTEAVRAQLEGPIWTEESALTVADAASIAQALPDLIVDELRAQRRDAALNLLKSAMEVAPLARHRRCIARAIEAGMSAEPRSILTGIWRVRPHELMAAIRRLSEPRQAQIANALAFSLATDPSIPLHRRTEIARALATHELTFTAEVLRSLRTAVDSADWLPIPSYLPLVESYPALLTSALAQRVWDEFASAVEFDFADEPAAPASQPSMFLEQPSGVLLNAAAQGGMYALTDTTSGTLAAALGRARPEHRARLASLCQQILDQTDAPSTDAIDAIATCISDRLDLLEVPEGILLLDALLRHRPEDRGPGERLIARVGGQPTWSMQDALEVARPLIHPSTVSVLLGQP